MRVDWVKGRSATTPKRCAQRPISTVVQRDDALGAGTAATRSQERPTKSGRGLTMKLSDDELAELPREQTLNDRSNELLGSARRLSVFMIPTWRSMWWVVCNSLQVDNFVPLDRPPTLPPPNTSNTLHCDHDLGVAVIAHPHPNLSTATLFKSRSQCGLTG